MLTSPLRYPGGKAKLFGFFSNLINNNHLLNADYSEPYAGGAGLALKLLSSGFVGRIHLNDIDPAIYAFWYSALHRTEEFCLKIAETPVTIAEWMNQKAIYANQGTATELELGFAAFFLNRTSRSGIIEGSGPIGGYAQAGEWKVDVRLVKPKQIEAIRLLSKYAGQIELTNLDAVDFIRARAGEQHGIIYLDPPYYVKGSKLYKNFYNRRDHEEIASLMESYRDKNWVVSYDDVPEIREIYDKFQPISYELQYSAGAKASGREVIFLSDTLRLGEIEGFRAAA